MNNKPFIQRNTLIPALICTVLWGSAIPVVKTGYELLKIDSSDLFAKFIFAGYRFALAGLLVLLLLKLQNKPVKPQKDAWSAILMLCAVQTILQYVFYYLGVGNTSGVRVSVLSATSSFFSVIVDHFVFVTDKITPKKGIGCIIGFAGVIAILSGNGLGNEAIKLTGEGFMLMSAVGQGVGAVISRKVATGRDAMMLTGWQLFIGGLVLILVGLCGGGQSRIYITPKGLILLLYLALLSAVAFCLWTLMLKYHPVAKVTIYMFLVPVFGSILSAVILNENVFTIKNLIALMLVCIGILLVNKAPKKRE